MKFTKYEKAAADWLARAQDATKDGGISKFYTIGEGWCDESYKEVSGYIIPTFFDLYKKSKNKDYKNRAIKITDWELDVQEKNGKWEYVFDTGQIILGLARAYKETKNQNYKKALIKAADFLVKIQNKNGEWNKNIFALGIKNKILKLFGFLSHSYNSRTAWALLEVWKITKNLKYKKSAIKNLDWTLKQQLENGYYNKTYTYSHFLVYTARGFLESSLILKNKKYINSAKLFADKCLSIIKDKGFFPGNLNKKWQAIENYSCLVADAQLSILLFKLYKLTKNQKYKMGAKKLLNNLKNNQNLKTKDKGIYGGIPGSDPINGAYCPNMVLSWATKFYIDTILLIKKRKW